MFGSLRHEFYPLEREILERAFDAALAVIGDGGAKSFLRGKLIEVARVNGLSDPETMQDTLSTRLSSERGTCLNRQFQVSAKID